MAKSIRSKVKRHFRTQKRKTVEATEHYQQAELEKAEAQNAIANAPKPPRPLTSGPQLAFDRPSGMDVDDTLPPIISSNPAKLLKKLKKRRLGTQPLPVQTNFSRRRESAESLRSSLFF
jgi:Protein of unknown function (DUF2423)